MSTLQVCDRAPYEVYGCRVNALEPQELFAKYERAGFLYPAKREALRPFWPQIRATWAAASRAGDSLLRVVTCDDGHGAWASVCGWRTAQAQWQLQHLAGFGDVTATRAVILATLSANLAEPGHLASQNWFRPDNRFARRVFGSAVAAIGPETSATTALRYYRMPRRFDAVAGRHVTVHAVDHRTQDALVDFVASQYGRVSVEADGLRHEDFLLEHVDEAYRQVGLRRFRRIWLAWVPGRERPAGAAMTYRGPLGLNFSLLENRCELLVDTELAAGEWAPVAAALTACASTIYDDFPAAFIPLACSEALAPVVERLGATAIRPYSRTMWLRGGYRRYYQQVDSLYHRVIRGGHRRAFGSGAAHESEVVDHV